MRHSIVLVAILTVAAAIESGETQRILCVGDSITAAKGGWVKKLEAMDGFETLNGGRSGQRATRAKEQLTVALAKAQKAGFKADRVLLFLGVNDLPARDKRPGDVKVGICVDGMNRAIDLALKHFKPQSIIVLAPCDVNDKEMNKVNLGKGYQKAKPLLVKLEERYRELAKKRGVRFHSLLKVVDQGNYTDGLHPNDAGHTQIAESLAKFLSGPDKE